MRRSCFWKIDVDSVSASKLLIHILQYLIIQETVNNLLMSVYLILINSPGEQNIFPRSQKYVLHIHLPYWFIITHRLVELNKCICKVIQKNFSSDICFNCYIYINNLITKFFLRMWNMSLEVYEKWIVIVL